MLTLPPAGQSQQLAATATFTLVVINEPDRAGFPGFQTGYAHASQTSLAAAPHAGYIDEEEQEEEEQQAATPTGRRQLLFDENMNSNGQSTTSTRSSHNAGAPPPGSLAVHAQLRAHAQLAQAQLNRNSLAGSCTTAGGFSDELSSDDPNAPVNHDFMVSFLVDARGGAMVGCRYSGVKVRKRRFSDILF